MAHSYDYSIQPDTENVKAIVIEDSLPKYIKEALNKIHIKHEKVFDGDLRLGYNNYSGNFDVIFHFLNDIPPPINYGCVPSYHKKEDDVLLQTMIDKLEALNVVAKASSLNITPKFASPCMLVKKNSSKFLKKGEYEAMSVQEKINYNRFVLCQNKFNKYVQKIPAKYNKLEDTIRIVGNYEFVITTDLTDSFWQRHIAKERLPYFAFHSPFRGTYIFLRSTQGFLNQSEGLEEMLTCILQDFVAQGCCRIHADNLYILGHSLQETVENWKNVLDTLQKNNIKLSAKKTFCFPSQLDLLGWTKQGKFLIPDIHRQNCLLNTSRPNTVKELRSFLGSYRTFYRCKKDISFILRNLEQLTSNKPSSQKLPWTDELIQNFERAKQEIVKLDKIYLPKADDQLVLTSDYSKLGISATLWASVDNKYLVVARMSTGLEKAQENLKPCEGEAIACYVAARCPFFNSYILASNKKTIALLDNKPVVQAANLLEQGKFSSSKIINIVLTAIAELNMTFHHMSGKLGQNFADDHGSRNPILCKDRKICKICSFVDDCSQLMVSKISFWVADDRMLIGQVTKTSKDSTLIKDIISGATTIPFANKQAMRFLQDKDPVLRRVKELLLAGERPHPNEHSQVKRYLRKTVNITVCKDGCLVVSKLHKSRLVQRTLIVIPEDISYGLLQGLHLNLNHPTPSQLQLAVDTKFFLLDKDKKIRDIWENCTLCQSVATFPQEIQSFDANIIPDHPGLSFTADVIRIFKKKILIAMDNFSGFITTMFVPNEKADCLLDSLLQLITPFKASSSANVTVRTDQAPGFKSIKLKDTELIKLGIKLELGHAKNKNAVALIDRKIQELESEMKKLSIVHSEVSIKLLVKATAIVNEKIRNQGFSSREIMFCRDQSSHENLQIKDDKLGDNIMEQRNLGNISSANSKAKIKAQASSANAIKGNLVFLKRDGNKTKVRDLYLVTNVSDDRKWVTICKIKNGMGPQPAFLHPQAFSYEVKQTDIYLAPNQPIIVEPEIYVWEPPSLQPNNGRSSPPLDKQARDSDSEYWEFQEIDDEFDEEKEPEYNDNGSQRQAILVEENPSFPHPEQDISPSSESSQNRTSQFEMELASPTENPDPRLTRTNNPPSLPTAGNMIQYWDPDGKKIITAKIMPMNKSLYKHWPGWRNILIISSNVKKAINMDIYGDNCVAWRYIANATQADEDHTMENSENTVDDSHLDDTEEEPRLNLRVTVNNDLFSSSSEACKGPKPPRPRLNAQNSTLSPSENIVPSKVYRLPATDPVDHSKPVHRKARHPFKKKQ